MFESFEPNISLGGDETETRLNLRFNELLKVEGDNILSEVMAARKAGNQELVERLQREARGRVALQVASEFGLISWKRDEEVWPGDNGGRLCIPGFGDYFDSENR